MNISKADSDEESRRLMMNTSRETKAEYGISKVDPRVYIINVYTRLKTYL